MTPRRSPTWSWPPYAMPAVTAQQQAAEQMGDITGGFGELGGEDARVLR